jgi:uncharacterized membrane protein YeiB
VETNPLPRPVQRLLVVALCAVLVGVWLLDLESKRALVILAVQTVFSRWWLARFRYGPLEWGLRCVTWWGVVSLRR